MQITKDGKKEHPILFATPLVNAILAGRKTQTRRIATDTDLNRNPFGEVGDRFWVRETFRYFNASNECGCSEFPCSCPKDGTVLYKATHDDGDQKWKPSIHMPRSAARILLELTGVRSEKLNDISPADAVKEGLIQLQASGRYVLYEGAQYFGEASRDPREVFRWLWESIYGSNAWDSNPNVYVADFKVLEVK